MGREKKEEKKEKRKGKSLSTFLRVWLRHCLTDELDVLLCVLYSLYCLDRTGDLLVIMNLTLDVRLLEINNKMVYLC